MYRYGFVLIIIGIVVGLIIAAGFNFTDHLDAVNPPPTNSESEMKPKGDSDDGIAVLNQMSTAFANVAERVNPSVVTIFTETVVKGRSFPFHRLPFEEFFGEDFGKFFQTPQNPPREQKQYGLGSGVIVSDGGIILTNNHVVKDADNIKIRLIDGKEYKAEVKGKDASTDLAIIKIDEDDLPALEFGNSDDARVGEWVLAIGSPLSAELAHSVTSGIISAKGRSGLFDQRYEDFIQTDAAINPGNSGGALVNLNGELIGINTAIASRNGGFMGIGFAIPSNLAHKVMTDILEKGRVVRGWLGVYIQEVNKELADALGLKDVTGVLISSVQEGSPAEKAGLKSEDVILKFNDKNVKNPSELSTKVASAGPNTEVKLHILRDRKEKVVTVKLGELPEDEQPTPSPSKESIKVGIKVANITSDLIDKYELKSKTGGVVITYVERESIAEQSGLRSGDVILKVNKKPVNNVAEYNDIMEDVKEGDTVLFYIQRGDAKIFVAFTIPE